MVHLISRSDHIAVSGPPFALGVLALPPNCPPTRAPTAHLDTPSARTERAAGGCLRAPNNRIFTALSD